MQGTLIDLHIRYPCSRRYAKVLCLAHIYAFTVRSKQTMLAVMLRSLPDLPQVNMSAGT
jgi:hypothetical protein